MQWPEKTSNNRLLSMHRQNPAPLSSDEGAESGDDSEEDLVTSYISSSLENAARSSNPQPPQQLPINHMFYTPSAENQRTEGAVHQIHGHGTTRRLVRMAEIPTMDSVTMDSQPASHIPSIPTISITPHSPITQKPFAMLDESIRQLHGLQDQVQQLREDTLTAKSGRSLARLSSSCPSLNVEGEEIDDEDFFPSCKSGRSSVGAITNSRRGSDRSLRSDDGRENTPSPTTPLTSGSLDDHHLCPDTPKIRVNDSTPTGSEEFLLDARKPLSVNSEAQRRRSWAGLSDEEKKRARQRSVSLSSLDSDTEEPFYDQDDSSKQGSESLDGPCRRGPKHRSLSGSTSPVAYVSKSAGASSSTFSLNDEHYEEKTVKSKTEKPRLLAPRLTLQKSISTPSILAGVTNQQTQPEDSKLSYHYDDASTSKRRKRGSIFFRKKKDKQKKTSHQFVGVCYGNSATCDVCNKPMTNKPALRCETCLVCVHENTCKDQISDCSKFKNTKIIHKPILGIGSSVLNANAKSFSLGSAPGLKNDSRPSSRSGRTRSGHSSSPTRPHSFTAPSKQSDDKDSESQIESNEGNITEVNSASMESLEDGADATESTLDSIDTDPDLRLLDSEAELWVNTVSKELLSTLSEKEIKRQEHIYELIITEKHHCRMLKVLKELFAVGMVRELGMKETQVNSIFPYIDQLITIHFSFLWRLRERQRCSQQTEAIGDLLLQQFVGDNAQGLKEAYGGFCSQHQDAVANYKELLKNDRRFQTFIRARANHHLLKKKGIPEGILFVTHRVTKYPLMIEALLKYSKSQPEEVENLKKALEYVKEILVNINFQVAEKEKRQRLLEIYHKIDAKSSIMYNDQKFKKSDILTAGRKLMFEGQATLSQQRGKQLNVVMVVMTDLIFFLQDNNQKYYFVSPDAKAGAVPLGKLLVREKAGQDSKVIYLISRNQAEMFELSCVHPKDKKVWLDSIREAVDHCPTGDLSDLGSKITSGNSDKIHEILMLMMQQDKDIAKLCDEKVKNFFDMCSVFGSDVSLAPPNYTILLNNCNLNPDSAKELQMSSIIESLRLVTGSTSWGTNLARSVSSVGEHQSDAYVSPSLPKRAETFGGFDNPNGTSHPPKQSAVKKKKDSKTSLYSDSGNEIVEESKCIKPVPSSLAVRSSQDNISVSSLSGESNHLQQSNLTSQLVQHLSTVLVLSHHHLTQYEMLRAKMSSEIKFDGKFSHSQKLEELRNIQEQISHERMQWAKERDLRERWLSCKGDDLKKFQESLKSQQEDINQQREDLYRKLDALKSQGIILNPTLTVLPSSTSSYQSTSQDHSPITEFHTPGVSPHVSPTTGGSQRQRPDSKNKPPSMPPPPPVIKRDSSTILSSSNQQKLVKQQFPLKLAKITNTSSSSGSSTGSYSSMSSSFGGSPSQDHSSKEFGTKCALPNKISENFVEIRSHSSGVYKRIASPSLATEGTSSYQRTGSSLSDLHNGSPSLTANPLTKSHVVESERSSVMTSQELPTSNIRHSVSNASNPIINANSNAKPGQRIKDPDSDQDILFF